MNAIFKQDDAFIIGQQLIKTVEIWTNTGQITGLPANPRYIEEVGLNDLQTSIREIPEYLMARPLIVVPYAGNYIVLCGNMRLKACINEHVLEVPCIILNPDTPIERLKRYLIIDNVSYGKNDWDMIANEWEPEELAHWGMALPYFDTGNADTGPDDSDKAKEFKITIDCGFDETLHFRVKEAIAETLRNYPQAEMR